jgi:hypothetical protein
MFTSRDYIQCFKCKTKRKKRIWCWFANIANWDCSWLLWLFINNNFYSWSKSYDMKYVWLMKCFNSSTTISSVINSLENVLINVFTDNPSWNQFFINSCFWIIRHERISLCSAALTASITVNDFRFSELIA